MQQQFELFIRCLGLVLACLGLVLGLWVAAEWLQPGADLGSLFGTQLERLGAQQPLKDHLEAFREVQARSLLIRLLVTGVCPLILGVFLLVFAPSIAGICYR